MPSTSTNQVTTAKEHSGSCIIAVVLWLCTLRETDSSGKRPDEACTAPGRDDGGVILQAAADRCRRVEAWEPGSQVCGLFGASAPAGQAGINSMRLPPYQASTYLHLPPSPLPHIHFVLYDSRPRLHPDSTSPRDWLLILQLPDPERSRQDGRPTWLLVSILFPGLGVSTKPHIGLT